jgi:formiminoglutamase
MSGASSKRAEWYTRLEPASRPGDLVRRPDDPRLGEIVEFWDGNPAALRPGRAVLLGFPQDEGIRRNHGRVGAAEAPREIRRWLYRLTPWDGESDCDLAGNPPLDAGDLRTSGDLEQSQEQFGAVIAELLRAGAVPIVLGGGHETAFGHYLGYPWPGHKGHSGSPFRQAIEHPSRPLPGGRYICLGAEPSQVSRQHLDYVRERGGVVRWRSEVEEDLKAALTTACLQFSAGGPVYVSLDADIVRSADVPGVSAPNPSGLEGRDVFAAMRAAAQLQAVTSFDIVEVCPPLDPDGQSARWAALTVWNILMGLTARR